MNVRFIFEFCCFLTRECEFLARSLTAVLRNDAKERETLTEEHTPSVKEICGQYLLLLEEHEKQTDMVQQEALKQALEKVLMKSHEFDVSGLDATRCP